MTGIQDKDTKAVLGAEKGLCEEFTRVAYDQTFAEVMRNPARDGDDILKAAACADMDIIFGEDHSVASETMRQIAELTGSLPEGHVKAIALESPVEMQELFDPATLQDISLQEFAYRSFVIDIEQIETLAGEMLEAGGINEAQHAYLMEHAADQRRTLDETFAIPDIADRLQYTFPGQMYEMAKTALENGTPVIAADADRQRQIGLILSDVIVPEDIRMSDAEFADLFHQGVDDLSDVDLLKDMGIDLDGPGVLLVHRGYAHINGKGWGEAAGTEQTNGIDDILERSGREVLTIEIGPDYAAHSDVPDPADISLNVDGMGEAQLDRSAYQASEGSGAAAPADINALKPGG